MTLEELIAGRDALIERIGVTAESITDGDKSRSRQYSDSVKTLAWYDAEIARLTATTTGTPIQRCTYATFSRE